MFIEMAFIQQFIRYLAHPLYAVSVVLCGFLVFSGIGSRFAPRLALNRSGGIVPVILCLVSIALIELWVLPWVFAHHTPLEEFGRVLLSLVLIAPLAFCMGMPFSFGLSRLDSLAPALVPWAWGINGFASLVSAVLATLLAIHIGFTLVVISAATLYLLAAAMRL